jgi:PPK2 family polyphosphate:nucleotide phosphotransferase
MKIDKFRVREGAKLNLKNYKTDDTDGLKDKDEAKEALANNIKRMSELQDTLYAQDDRALLIIFQAMDAAGKDSAIEHVMSGINPQGVQVTSFKQPSSEELDHDYLWRCAKAMPERGRIGIFNRSHYEEVLVVRVHDFILQAQHLPDDIKKDKNIWKQRFKQIRNYEDYLADNGTTIIKFFLHVSKEEQKKRFLARIDTPDKNWKFSMADTKERAFWDEYMKAYRDAIEATSTDMAPWYIIPADKKWFTRLAVSEVIVKTMESLKLHYPVVTEEHKKELEEARKMLEGEK